MKTGTEISYTFFRMVGKVCHKNVIFRNDKEIERYLLFYYNKDRK
ncbi:hypothetical protein CE91St54_36280 [Hungatella hathewayi]|uniref:Uncharacterized protein n=2 Tax=Hungatella hathewayi TaxID=154046 RepID=D3AQ63_9FIRM|nr:hypothetical protein CLOSTHATH_05769 [Hungatella hathewayi DSM 13479]GKH03400.1 hypothetical protein CE91St55_53810 [Hungatella hathewayi]GKH08520.1 hypothetical protein CE91St54_36280 [Hungatella hathewayi]